LRALRTTWPSLCPSMEQLDMALATMQNLRSRISLRSRYTQGSRIWLRDARRMAVRKKLQSKSRLEAKEEDEEEEEEGDIEEGSPRTCLQWWDDVWVEIILSISTCSGRSLMGMVGEE